MTALEGTPTLDDVKAWLGLEEADDQDDVVLQESLDAALDAQANVVRYPSDRYRRCGFTKDLREAVFLRTQRLAARRNSPEGVVGLSGAGGDFVAARVPSFDNDVLHLEGPYRRQVIA
jgi:hypothetical protein